MICTQTKHHNETNGKLKTTICTLGTFIKESDLLDHLSLAMVRMPNKQTTEYVLSPQYSVYVLVCVQGEKHKQQQQLYVKRQIGNYSTEKTTRQSKQAYPVRISLLLLDISSNDNLYAHKEITYVHETACNGMSNKQTTEYMFSPQYSVYLHVYLYTQNEHRNYTPL